MAWQNSAPTRPSRLSRRAGGRSGLKRPYRAQVALVRSHARMTQVIERPELVDSPLEAKEPMWLVTVFNNDTNTYEEVITILVLATGCTAEEAAIEAWEIDNYGQCVVHRASEGDCKSIADIVSTIGIKVEALPEP